MLLTKAIQTYIDYLNAVDRSKATVDGYKKALKYFNNFIETKYNAPQYIEDLEISDIQDYLSHTLKKGNTASSRARDLYILRSFYNYTCKNEITQKNLPALIENIKYTRQEREYLLDEEINALISAIDHPIIKNVVITLFYTGMRISECLNLTLENVDMKNKVIHVIQGKGGKNRNIPISDKLSAHLSKYLQVQRPDVATQYFFATEASGSLTPRYVNKIIGMAVKELGWQKKVSAHTLRHSFASKLIRQNVNLVKVQKLLGHSNLKVTSIYTHSSIAELAESVNVL